MQIINRTADKQLYCTPAIAQVTLDSAISLALQSDPPLGPDELAMLHGQDYIGERTSSTIFV